PEVDAVEELAPVAVAEDGRQLGARSDADAHPGVLGVLELAELRGRRELLEVAVLDAGVLERRLQPHGVGPRVLAPAHAAALAHVEELARAAFAQRGAEGVGGPAVDAAGGQ